MVSVRRQMMRAGFGLQRWRCGPGPTGGYIVEAAIALGAVQARPGVLIGIDFQVNDDGTGTGVRSSAATWSDETGRAYLDPSRFGVLRLLMGNAAARSTGR